MAKKKKEPKKVLRLVEDIIKPFPRQMEFLESTDKHHFTLYGGSAGSGKGIACCNQVITPFGPREMGSLEIGSQVSNPAGGVARVIATNELPDSEIFKVTLDDGSATRVTSGHLWLYRICRNMRKATRTYIDGEECDWRVATTLGLIEMMGRGRNLRVPSTEPVTFTTARRYKGDIDPYLLGLLLGDGYLGGIQIQCATADDEIASFLGEHGFVCTSGIAYRVGGQSGKKLGLSLERLNLRGKLAADKFVPHEYLYGSIMNRWSILQGLLDTDGHADVGGRIQFVSVSLQLATDVQFLVRSLGGKATMTSKIGSYRDLTGEKIECQRAYMLYIRFPAPENAFRLTRKREQCEGHGGFNSREEICKKIVSIEKDGVEDARCIQVDHPNGLILTDDFVTSHNSYIHGQAPQVKNGRSRYAYRRGGPRHLGL